MGAEKHASDKIQNQGRKADPSAERYPSVNKDDSIDLSAENPKPRQDAGESAPRASDPTLDQSAAKR
jgi:hypothetical protein